MLKHRTKLIVLVVVAIAAVAVFALNNNTMGTDAIQHIAPAEYQNQFVEVDQAHLLIDVRTPQEFADGHIPGAINIPVESLAGRLNEVTDAQPVVVYCRSGNRSAQAAQILAQAGYSTVYDLGGISAWTAQGFAIE